MLICPHCKFENPDDNKFCQNCGTSLTHRVCPQCATDVAVNTQYCYNCGAECGTVWWAIIVKKGSGESGVGSGELGEAGEENITPCAPPAFPVGSYLDPQQRYQLLEPLPTLEDMATNTEVCVRVLDCEPYQISPLAVMLANEQLGLGEMSSLAKPYIALQSECRLGIPPIHDAWQEGDMQVVLIEDRSHWQHLLELWHEDTTSSLQIVHCFYQMTQLWSLLETVNCRQSLLEWSNLRLDEDQTVALQRLHVERLMEEGGQDVQPTATEWEQEAEGQTTATQQQPFTIKALGRIWQRLFRQSQRTQFGAVVQLLGELEVGKIQTSAELQRRLQAIAAELQGNAAISDPTITPVPEKGTTSPTILQLEEKEDSGAKSDDMPTVVLPMQLVSLEHAALTNVGRQRDHNEDYFGIETQIHKVELPSSSSLLGHGLYILCDGMGGHAGGEVASALAVERLRQYFQTHFRSNQLPTEEQIRCAVLQANQAIYDLNQQDARSGVGRMGTTLVMVLIQDTQVAVAHVGDSRLYRLTRKRKLEQVTVDHEVGQREISRGVDKSIAYARADAYQLTQALGPRDENFIFPDVQFLDINEDTLFLLASDGLSDNNLLEIHWQTHLEPLLSSGVNLENGVRGLIDLANNYNGHDNITAIVIKAKVRPNLEQQL
ncbi:MAG: serine/threonine phosphatase [Stigonema ocellatum SAG 48.90 = DSM 106950]|nr:serine/threonine phosphatase [Stigonema ocellatum SAG 48.90 = DSM 106950]